VFGVFLNDSYTQPSPPKGLSYFFLGTPIPTVSVQHRFSTKTYGLPQALHQHGRGCIIAPRASVITEEWFLIIFADPMLLKQL
jgi:hypothetical protein